MAALLDEAQALPVKPPTHPNPTAALVNSPDEALADQAVQATAATMKALSPVEIGETTPVPTEAIAATSVPWTLPPADTVTISQEFCETSWRPLLQVDRVIWPIIPSRLQTTAAAAIQQMADGLLSICASEGKVLGLASCARAKA